MPSAESWKVADTLVVFNDSLIPGDFTPPAGGAGESFAVAYDNRSNEVYAVSVDDTISVISDSTNKVVDQFRISTVQYITGIVYDYENNEIFVSFTGSPATVNVYSTVSNSLVASVTVGNNPNQDYLELAYDSGLGEVFVPNYASQNASVISTSTNKVVATVALPGDSPNAMAYDPRTAEVFATNDETSYTSSGNVSIIADSSNTVVKTTKVGFFPYSLVYDSGTREMFVGSDYNYGSLGARSNVSVINDTTDRVVATPIVGVGPEAMAYDSAHHQVWVTNANGNESLINDTTDAIDYTIPLSPGSIGATYDPSKDAVWILDGSPPYASPISDTTHAVGPDVLLTFVARYLAYDSAHQEEFIPDYVSDQVAVISDTTNQVVAMIPDVHAYNAVYDQGKGEVWTATSGPAGLSVINDTTNTVIADITLPGLFPSGLTYDPAQGEIFVGNAGGNNSVTVINDTTDAIVAVIPNVGTDPFTLVYDSGKDEVFVSSLEGSDLQENLTVINAQTNAVVTTFNLGSTAYGMVYDSGKGEIFTANYDSRNVSVISDATNKAVATIYVGTFPWSVAYDSLDDEIFVGTYNDVPENVTVISDITDRSVGSVFPVGQTPTALGFDPVTGGLYAADSSDGAVAVITSVSSGQTHYPVTFTESGLPSGTAWSVSLGSTQNTTSTTSLGFSEPNGSYDYGVVPLLGYSATPSTGSVTVNDGPQTVDIVFTVSAPSTYTVAFTETGLPTGTDWSILVDATTYSSTTSVITFSSPNEGYSAGIRSASVAGLVYFPTVPSQSPTFIEEPLTDCPGLPTTDTYCGELIVAGGPVSVGVVFQSAWVLNWLPIRDSYKFYNPIDYYSRGNCYGVSETEVLYWHHDIAQATDFPYLPIQPGGASNTSDLAWNGNQLNNGSLAVTVHQIFDPGNVGLVKNTLLAANFNQADQFAALQRDVETQGEPTILAMGGPNASGKQVGYHAVVVYGMVSFTNGSAELNISDPNDPGAGTNAWYIGPTSTFNYYYYGDVFHQFVVAPLRPLDSSFLDGESLFNTQGENLYPENFVLSDVPVSIVSQAIYKLPAGLLDSFGDNGGGDSQTFSAQIPGSSGFEEGSVQAYALPFGTPYTVDPPAAGSTELVVRSVNQSGTNILYGFRVGTQAPVAGEYNLTPNTDGFDLTTQVALTLKNVTFYYADLPTYAQLEVYNLSVASGDTARFTVDAWTGLNSTLVPSVTLQLYSKGSSTPYRTVQLTNGEDGLPTVAPSSSNGYPPSLVLYGGIGALGVAALVAAVVVLYRRKKKEGNHKMGSRSS